MITSRNHQHRVRQDVMSQDHNNKDERCEKYKLCLSTKTLIKSYPHFYREENCCSEKDELRAPIVCLAGVVWYHVRFLVEDSCLF